MSSSLDIPQMPWEVKPPLTGPAGPAGPAGEKGEKGAAGEKGEKGEKGVSKFTVERTFVVDGEVTANELEGFFVSLPAGKKKLLGIRTRLAEGTSCKVTVKKNGVALEKYKEKEVKSTEDKEYAEETIELANNDRISLQILSPVGTPKDLAVTVKIEIEV